MVEIKVSQNVFQLTWFRTKHVILTRSVDLGQGFSKEVGSITNGYMMIEP